LKCLERDPNRRYGGAGAVAAELRRFLRGEAIRARPLSRFARLWRWAKRKPALATAAALAGLVMVAGPVAALMINSQRRELDGRVQELDKLVIGQQEANRALRGKNAELQQTLESLEEMRPGVEENVLEWRRALIAAVVDRHYDAAARALAGNDLDLDSRAQIHLGLGMMLAAIPRVDEAVEHLSTAKDALEKLASEYSNDKRILAALADCCEQLAEVSRAAGRDEPAGEAAARAVEIRQRLAGARPSDAAAQVDVLASHYLLPVAGESLAAIPAASQRVIDEWPSDAAGIYQAACRLTLRTPLLNAAPVEARPSP
jgi:hypothetical protein